MSELDRREFIAFVGRACAGVTALGSVAAESAAADEARPDDTTPGNLEAPAVYRGKNLAQVALPLGGLGTGNLALGGYGTLRDWQIFNQCNPQARLAATFFAVWAQAEGEAPIAKLLQTEAVGQLPTIEEIEFAGEYPFAWITYKDGSLPVQIRLEAYNPLIPLNAKDSGIPGAVFRFTLKNPGTKPVAVSLAATCQNAVGFDGFASFDEANGNRNRYEERNGLHLLRLTTGDNAQGAGLNRPVVLLTESRPAALLARFFLNADLRFYESLADAPAALTPTATARVAVQRGTPPAKRPYGPNETFDTPDAPVVALVDQLDPARSFAALEKFVAEGGALVVLGDTRSLLEAAGTEGEDTTAILYDDFEAPKYDPAKWTVEGEAFGDGPVTGTLPNQQQVSGFQGQRLVNSFRNGDGTTGRLLSKPFPIQRRYIHFLIGGGNHPRQTCINLRVGGRIVRTATGRNEEQLRPERWDVRPFLGHEGVLEIVDTRQDGWGHINIDEIVFSDHAIAPNALSPEIVQKLRNFLPFTFTALEDLPNASVPGTAIVLRDRFRVLGFAPKPDAPGLEITNDPAGEPGLVQWQHGKGRVLIALGGTGESFRANAIPAEARRNFLGLWIGKITGLEFTPSYGMPATHPYFGSMALATNAATVSHKAQWDSLETFWQDFAADGALDASDSIPSPPIPEKTWNGALAVPISLAPGAEREVVFWLGWHFPNRYRDRSYDVGWGSNVREYEVLHRLGNRYNTWFHNADEVVAYLHHNDARLHKETRLYHDTFYDSSLPRVMRDAISSQVCILRSQTSMWLEDGHWMAYEGLGCCPMNCTHVYNYAQALAKLWPELERSVRTVDLTVQLQEDGGVRHRVLLPLDGPRSTGPFTDGHLSTICKAYREHLQSPDNRFLTASWPAIRKAMDFAVRVYDADGDGMVEGRQPNTYDCEVYGHNSFISTQYLAALRAAEEMAREQGDAASAQRYHALFEKGRRNLDQTCWNGEYYQQVYDTYLTTPTQYGPGCLADQLLGQWWAHVLNLGYLLPPERVRAALQAVFKYNFIPDFTHWDYHGQRVFADGKDQGLVCCTWPKGGRPEKVAPILYCDEVWTGVEYQVAAHMLYEGLNDEGLKIIAALRSRYNGTKRNPWDEIECSSHYSRAMASWSTLLAASGYHYHGPEGVLGFAPRLQPEDFRAFFTTADGWGTFTQKRPTPTPGQPASQENSLALAYGSARLAQLHLTLPAAARGKNLHARVTMGTHRVPTTVLGTPHDTAARLTFSAPLTLKPGQTLRVLFTWT